LQVYLVTASCDLSCVEAQVHVGQA
jgi:hypothetical protein